MNNLNLKTLYKDDDYMDNKEFFQNMYEMTNSVIDKILENLPPIDSLLKTLDFTKPKDVYYALSWDIETATIVYQSLKRIQCPLTVTEYIENMLVRAKIYVDDIVQSSNIIKDIINDAMNCIDSDPKKFNDLMGLYQYHMDRIAEYKGKLHEYSKALNPNYIKDINYNT